MPPTLKDWTAIIPIRKGSKGLANKNVKSLAGKPLYQYTVDQALQAGAQRIVITTDIEQVLETSHHEKVTLVERPSDLCTDNTPMYPVVAHALSATQTKGIFVLLQVTSPLRNSKHIVDSILEHDTGENNLVLSVEQADSSVLKWGYVQDSKFETISDIKYCFSNRQSLPAVFKPNGAIYIADSEWFHDNGGFETDKIGVVLMNKQESIDIDTQANFDKCELLISTMQRSAA